MKMKISILIIIAGSALLALLAACSSFSTVSVSDLNDGRVNGLLYYLPRGRISITGDFKSAQGGGTTKPATGSDPAGGAPTDATTSGTSQSKNFTITIAADVEADPSARYYLKPDRNYFYDDDIHLTVNAKHLLSTGNATANDETAQIIETTFQIAEEAAGVPAEAVAPAIGKTIKIRDLLHVIDGYLDAGTVKPSVTIPSFTLNQFPAAFGDFPDRTKAEGVESLNRDKNREDVTLGEIDSLIHLYSPEADDRIVDTTNATAFFQKLKAALTTTKQGGGGGQGTPANQPKPFSIVFDPGDSSNYVDAISANKLPIFRLNGPMNGYLDQCGFDVRIEELPQQDVNTLHSIWSQSHPLLAHGIVFRSVKPYLVTVKSRDANGGNTPGSFYINQSQLVLLPDTDPAHTLVLDYSRMPFVKKVTSVSFVDGEPQDFAQTVPSPVLGFLAIPKAIIEAMVPNPLQSKPASSPAGVAPAAGAAPVSPSGGGKGTGAAGTKP